MRDEQKNALRALTMCLDDELQRFEARVVEELEVLVFSDDWAKVAEKVRQVSGQGHYILDVIHDIEAYASGEGKDVTEKVPDTRGGRADDTRTAQSD